MKSEADNPEYAQIRKKLEAELYRLREHYQVPAVDPERKPRQRNKGKAKAKG